MLHLRHRRGLKPRVDGQSHGLTVFLGRCPCPKSHRQEGAGSIDHALRKSIRPREHVVSGSLESPDRFPFPDRTDDGRRSLAKRVLPLQDPA